MADGLAAEPCPFCGESLTSSYDRLGYPYKHAHTSLCDCLMRGRVIGGDQTRQWNSARQMHMKIDNDLPTFNWQGIGESTNIEMVNATIAFLASEKKGKHDET